MAYVIGRKVVKDTKEFDSYAYGITLPLGRGETGFFQQAFVSFEQAKSNLKNLLLTKKGERIMQPNFGELKDKNQVNVELEFTVGNQIDLHELTFTVQGT